jgi:hypothetical protein
LGVGSLNADPRLFLEIYPTPISDHHDRAMPEAMDLAAAGDTLVTAGLFKESIGAYTKAIELVPTSPLYYVKRFATLSCD